MHFSADSCIWWETMHGQVTRIVNRFSFVACTFVFGFSLYDFEQDSVRGPRTVPDAVKGRWPDTSGQRATGGA